MSSDLPETILMPVTMTVVVGPDDANTLKIPLGSAWACKKVRVTVEEIAANDREAATRPKPHMAQPHHPR
jgi:hypothetical protein